MVVLQKGRRTDPVFGVLVVVWIHGLWRFLTQALGAERGHWCSDNGLLRKMIESVLEVQTIGLKVKACMPKRIHVALLRENRPK